MAAVDPLEPFAIDVDAGGPVLLLRVGGEVDASTAGALGEAFDLAVREHEGHVVLDAGGVTFIDSTGISTLVAGMRRLNRTRRRLALACEPASPLGRALEMTGLHHTFDVHRTADAAVAALAGAPLLGR
jgi:anti-sigma B factor antagonist